MPETPYFAKGHRIRGFFFWIFMNLYPFMVTAWFLHSVFKIGRWGFRRVQSWRGSST